MPNNGLKQWQIPNVTSDSCYLRLQITTYSESCFVMSGPFTIVGGQADIIENQTQSKTLNITYLIQNDFIKIPINR